jgi:hypothetical protein
MAYVPGFRHDVFVSYAHGDDREWTLRFVERLKRDLDRWLGSPVSLWVDKNSNPPTADFAREIPENVQAAAAFLLLPSPTYIRSPYCVDVEYQAFASTIDARRAKFAAPNMANELFVARCPILPVDDNEHWALFPGATDIPFYNDDSGTFETGSPDFEKALDGLVGHLSALLKRMRNHSTPVFLHPSRPGADLQPVHKSLIDELAAHGYRVLPDRQTKVAEQLREAALSVFLIGESFDEATGTLIDIAAGQRDKPWVVWASPSVANAAADQAGLCLHVEQLDSPSKTFLDSGTIPAKVKEEILGLLKPPVRAAVDTSGRPTVYLVYNAQDLAERKNAGLISYTFRKEIYFEHPDIADHRRRLSQSEGVLLVWGCAEEKWCERELLEILHIAPDAPGRGMCLFDPKDPKLPIVSQLRSQLGDKLHIAEQFGGFDRSRLEAFFRPLLDRSKGASR